MPCLALTPSATCLPAGASAQLRLRQHHGILRSGKVSTQPFISKALFLQTWGLLLLSIPTPCSCFSVPVTCLGARQLLAHTRPLVCQETQQNSSSLAQPAASHHPGYGPELSRG